MSSPSNWFSFNPMCLMSGILLSYSGTENDEMFVFLALLTPSPLVTKQGGFAMHHR